MILLTAYQYHNRKMAERAVAEADSRTAAPVRQKAVTAATVPARQTGALQEASKASVSSLGTDFVPAPPGVTDKQKEIREKGIRLFNRKDYEGALNVFRQVDKPDNQVLLGIGLCYFRLGNYESSVSFLNEVLDKDKRNFVALKISAFDFYRLDDIEDGLASARRGLSLRNDAELQALYGKLGRERKTLQGYAEESSSHFRILFDGYKEGGIDREILDTLEDAYRTIGQDLDCFPAEPVTVILYTKRNFYDITQAPHWSGGEYDGKIRIPVRGIDLNRSLMKKVLFHEYTHVVVHYLAHSCPLWLNEGLAEYFSTRYPGRIGQVIPLRDLERSLAGLSDKEVALAYWESYSAVSALIDKYGLYSVETMLEAFGRGESADEAFRDGFGVTYSQFVSGWGKGGKSSF